MELFPKVLNLRRGLLVDVYPLQFRLLQRGNILAEARQDGNTCKAKVEERRDGSIGSVAGESPWPMVICTCTDVPMPIFLNASFARFSFSTWSRCTSICTAVTPVENQTSSQQSGYCLRAESRLCQVESIIVLGMRSRSIVTGASCAFIRPKCNSSKDKSSLFIVQTFNSMV